MRLTIEQSHVYITQQLQRQGAFKRDRQFKEAIDLALNNALTKFIRSRVKPSPDNPLKFEIDEANREDIEALIEVNKPLTVFRRATNKAFAVLPADLKYLISDSSSIVEDCSESFKDPTETKSEVISIIRLEDSANTLPPYYQSIKVTNNSVSETITGKGFNSTAEKIFLIDHIIFAFKRIGVDAHWEKYKDIYKTGCFLIPLALVTDVVTLTVDNNIITTSNTNITSTYYKSASLTTFVGNRNVKHSFISDILDSNYHKPIPTSPVTTLSGKSINIYHSERFLVNQILVDYVRIPRPVSLSLGQGFETHESTHDRICDIAVEILKEQVEAASLQTKVGLDTRLTQG